MSTRRQVVHISGAIASTHPTVARNCRNGHTCPSAKVSNERRTVVTFTATLVVEKMSGVTPDIFVTPDGEAAAAAAAALLAEAAAASGSIVLAGGSTPRRAYELAAGLQSDWGDAEIWFGDDRCVAPRDPRSNQLLVREALLDRLVVPPAVRAMATTLPPDAAAALYDAALTGEVLDLVLLGLGPDGHTASLFPNASSLDVTDRLVVAVEAGSSRSCSGSRLRSQRSRQAGTWSFSRSVRKRRPPSCGRSVKSRRTRRRQATPFSGGRDDGDSRRGRRLPASRGRDRSSPDGMVVDDQRGTDNEASGSTAHLPHSRPDSS